MIFNKEQKKKTLPQIDVRAEAYGSTLIYLLREHERTPLPVPPPQIVYSQQHTYGTRVPTYQIIKKKTTRKRRGSSKFTSAELVGHLTVWLRERP